MELRNPFAIKDNEVVMIEDIPIEERGLRCSCICPFCKEPFEAKMGDVRRHHFSHTGKGCDEINAYMMGLYMLLSEFISSGNSFYLPPVIVGFKMSDLRYYNEDNVEEKTFIRSHYMNEKNEILVHEEGYVRFQNATIETDNNQAPKAVIAEVGGKKLAIVITPPDTVCKAGRARQYKNYSTLEVDFTHLGDTIQQSKKEEFYSFLSEHKELYSWIYTRTSKMDQAYSNIVKMSEEYRIAEENRAKKLAEENRAKKLAEENRIKKLNEENKNKQAVNRRQPVYEVWVNGVTYSVGTMVRYKSEVGQIIEITKLNTGKHEITILFLDKRKRKFEIETLVQYKMISKL